MGLKSKPLDQVRADVPVAAVMREEVARININVPLSMRKQWKTAAAQANRPLTDLIVDAMTAYLNTQRH
jgi:hypothetical protein